MYQAFSVRQLTFSGAACLSVVLLGCGGGDDGGGAGSVHVSGAVTFNGTPVPGGQIVFEPDLAAGNSGASGFADILDGRYDTKQAGRGTVGGAQVVRIQGMSGPAGEAGVKPLFNEYRTNADVGQTSGTVDFEVPASAAEGLIIGEEA